MLARLVRHVGTTSLSKANILAGSPRVLTLSASPHSSPALDLGHSAPIITSDASTPGPINHSCENQVNQQAHTQGSSTQPSPPSTTTPRQAKLKFYCTLCDRVRPFKNESDWRKHEKEHDTDYVCMLGGPKEATSQGIQCAFCGIQDPNDAHLFGHNAQACSPGSPGLQEGFSTKRRYEMVGHLRAKHGIDTASQGEAIAGKWKHTVKKQAWSCCFCVNVFASFNERLSHIASKHYDHGHTIDEWDATNVIQGLLQQPGVIKAWEEKLTSLPPWEVTDIIWERDAIKDLQQGLEVGPSDETTAVVLVEAAYNARRVNWGMESEGPRAVTAPEVDGTNNTTLLSSSRLPSPTTSPNMSVSNQNQPPSIFRIPNGLFANDLVNQDNPQVDHTYSSDFMPEWNDDEGQHSLFPGSYYQA